MTHHTEIRQTPAAMDAMRRTRCVREAATMLVLSRTGTVFEEATITALWDDVATVASEFCASPDDIQRILVMHEPSLAVEAP
jgi:hypothetical protein